MIVYRGTEPLNKKNVHVVRRIDGARSFTTYCGKVVYASAEQVMDVQHEDACEECLARFLGWIRDDEEYVS